MRPSADYSFELIGPFGTVTLELATSLQRLSYGWMFNVNYFCHGGVDYS